MMPGRMESLIRHLRGVTDEVRADMLNELGRRARPGESLDWDDVEAIGLVHPSAEMTIHRLARIW